MNNHYEVISSFFDCYGLSHARSILGLLADTQSWLDDMAKECFMQLPVADKKKFLRKTYYLTTSALAHILERHYYKINRYPHAGKFTIPVVDILHYIREAFSLPVSPVPGCLNFQRIAHTDQSVGFDKNGQSTGNITILTDGGGKIITAFPGLYNATQHFPFEEEILSASNGVG